MRRILYIIAGLLVLGVVVAASLPLWLPWVLKPVAAKIGFEYDEYDRIGYSRFALLESRFENESVSFSADRVEGFLPLAWFRRALTGSGGERDYLSVDGWRLEVDPPEREGEDEPGEVFAYEVFGQVDSILRHVVRWVPRVSVSDGTVGAGPVEIAVGDVVWNGGRIDGRAGAEVAGKEYEVALSGDVRESSRVSLEAELLPPGAGLALVARRGDEALTVRGEATWEGNRMAIDARFGRKDVLPAEAELRSDSIEIPAGLLNLGGEYEALAGMFRGVWSGGSFEIDARAEAVPGDSEVGFPRAETEIRAVGDRESVRLEAATVRMPFLRAELTAPMEVDYRGRLLTEESVLRVEGDLAEQGFLEASGTFDLRLGVSPGATEWPDIAFSLSGESLAAFGASGEYVDLEGRASWTEAELEEADEAFPWPRASAGLTLGRVEAFGRVVERVRAEASFVPPVLDFGAIEAGLSDGTVLSGFADFDVRENRVGEGEFRVDLREETVREYLPEGVGFDRADLTARVSGPLEAIGHEVEIALHGLVAPAVTPGDLAVSWRGTFLDFEDWTVEWRNEEAASIVAEGAFSGARDRVDLDLRRLAFARDGEELLTLEAPVHFELIESESDADVEFLRRERRLVLDGLTLEGPDRRIALDGAIDWPERGELNLEIDHFGADLLRHYLTVEIPDFDFERFAFRSSWEDEGALRFSLENRASALLPGEERMYANLFVAGDADGVRIESLSLSGDQGEVLVAEGRVPVALYPARVDEPLAVDRERELEFRASSDPEATLWERLDSLTGIALETPELAVDLTGTLLEPRGTVSFRAARMEYTRIEETPQPVVSEIDIRMVFDTDEARLEGLRFLVEGQQVRAEAVWPLGEEVWGALLTEGRIPDWNAVEGSLVIDRAEVAPFARFFPEFLAPQGTLSVDLALRGARFERGEILLEGAATRPIMPVGSIQEMRARILFEDRTAILEEFSGRLGGERLRLTGRMALSENWEPEFDVSLNGENLPLTRQPGLVIRGDIDLRVRVGGEGTPSVMGRIDMRESLVITELRAMAPVSVATPERRPPFFSVDREPFSRWLLDIDIRGDEFLSVRAPGFRGRLSADFNLRGTLIEPQAIGEVQIDSGRIRFPFAAMRINQGTVALRQDDPYRPQLFVTASTRIFGYDLNMELRGTADDPIIEFTSHPPLSSEAILLMITAGELPRGEMEFTGRQKATKLALYVARNLFLEFGGDGDAAERLTIRSGENISEQGRETMYIEYMFWPRVGVVGEYDRFDAFNAGIKWRIFSH